MASRDGSSQRGFTLIEVVIASALLVTMASGVAFLAAVSVRSAEAARRQTSSVLLASQKLEQLRALTWTVDPADPGLSLTDTTTDLSRQPATGGGAGLRPSPAGSLQANTAGYVDYLSGRGLWLGTGLTPPAGTVYVRRWRVLPLPARPDDSVILQVLVTSVRRAQQMGSQAPLRDDALVTTVKSRKLEGGAW
jgi:prepilin-type N-terminal cleavage/methylation domain-containing protein